MFQVETIHRVVLLDEHQTLKVFHAQLNDVESTNNLQTKDTSLLNYHDGNIPVEL